ncbi:MAG: DUF3472 domain-containing protein [Burkholderiales bacterium]|nr:DUF3472 domain-containing protein [Burkholderiales bacterium]
MNCRRFVAGVGTLVLGVIFFFASDSPANAQTLSPRPTISAPYVNWTYARSYTTLDTDLKVLSDPGIGSNWFAAHQFSLADSAGTQQSGGYIGLQTNISAIGGQKGIMFSIWNATLATAGTGATCQRFTTEGSGMQCYMAYSWSANKTYRLRLVNDRGLAFKAYVIDMSTATPTQTYVGQIQAPTGVVAFAKTSVQWIEYYGSTPGTCAAYPYIKLLWSKPSGDDGAVLADGPTYSYGNGYCKNAYVQLNGSHHQMDLGNVGSSSRVNLLTSLNKYVYAVWTSEGCGGGGVKPNATDISVCSKLTRVALPGGKVALQAENGYYLSCANGGGSTVSANKRVVTANESFTETASLGTVSYKSTRGYYLTAVNYGTVDFKCSAYFPGSTEKFTPIVNKAVSSTVTVSSESANTDQYGVKAVDGAVLGYPGDYSKEWVTNGEGVGAWIKLQWPAATTVKQVILYDRPNTNDQVLAGTLSFSDGSSVAVGALPNDGSGLKVAFTARSITWIKFRIDQANGLVGLAEFEAY